ncbi:MAG: extradiol ring-cleavage dioxygenase, partial [Chloroflexota bacterium]|nr:extradiol ring-cleavage dioxygenase [Chloroflexota bacterium]
NAAIARLQQAVAERPLDALVIFGDDQAELFHDDLRPALAILWGDTVEGMPNLYADSPRPVWQAAAWAYGNKGQLYPVASELGLHLVESAIDAGFEPAHSNGLPKGKGIGHAFGFIVGRILNGRSLPIVPVIINTLYPPNQPLPDRCYQLGEVVRAAIEAWPKDMRIGIVGSGGLSHFVIDQDLDHRFLEAIRTHDVKTLRSLPKEKLNSGTSELRSWLAATAALEHLQMELIDYVPCYRTPAGTGMGMTFAIWK